jgi:hypothetical protein
MVGALAGPPLSGVVDFDREHVLILYALCRKEPDGRYVCVDINASHRPEENTGPLAALFYGFSILYCMTTSPAHGGAGLGTCGFNPHVAERMCRDAGFGEVRRLPLENPFNHVYEISR